MKNRTNESIPEKSSFSASQDSLLHHRQAVKSAIDGSLSSVHFNTQDARSVMRGVRTGEKRRSKRKKRRLPQLAFTFSLLLMITLPAALYVIRSQENIISITNPSIPAAPRQTAMNDPVVVPPQTPAPTALSTVSASDAPDASEEEAIRIARECFEAHCDTSIFQFEEYSVSVQNSEADPSLYTVTLESIYSNGCSFTVIISLKNDEVLQYSAPRLATTPTSVNMEADDVREWYEKYGEHLFTWPQDAQAEYSRRYQGGTLRSAKEGEITCEAAIASVRTLLNQQSPGMFNTFYPVLFSERTSADARAFYLVYCYTSDSQEALLSEEPMTVSFDAVTGDIIGIENNPLEN